VARIGTVLAGWPGEWVDRSRLIAEVWGDRPPRTAVNTLQAHISQLRRLLGKDHLLGDVNGYLLDVEPRIVDADRFEELTSEAYRSYRQLHLARTEAILSEALSLWRGTPYADSNNPDLLARRARLEEQRDVALENRLECRLSLATDQHALSEVIAHARELVTLNPLRERRHVLLIQALAAADRIAEAHAALQAATSHIRLVAATEPNSEISQLARSLQERSGHFDPRVRALPRTVTETSTTPSPNFESAVIDRVIELLVEHDVPVLILRADAALHDEVAACLTQALAGDFPLGVFTSNATSDDAPPEGAGRGMLRIITHADRTAIAAILSDRSGSGAATLLLTDDEPPQILGAVVVDATQPTNPPLRQTS
jgi:DNA-binding SARP family transcriptional activator